MQKSTNRFCNGKAMQLLLSFLVTGTPVALFAQSYQSLSEKVSVNLENTTADVVVKSLEKQTPYTFAYDPEYLHHCAFASVKFTNQPLADVLHYLDVYAPLDIAFTNKTVALKQGKQERAAGQDKGRVTGKVVDSKNEPLPGVTIQADNGVGAVTSVDGSYELSLQPGTYTFTFSYVSFDTRKITEVVVKEKTVLPLNIVLKSNSSHLKGVTVTGNYKKASVEGLYALQKNNAAISDGISAEQIARTPDKNIGEVLKRVSGLSTMDNKYVVVRGLSERYNQAVLNGQVMPSTELNRKNFSFDIIPSNIVDNVTVVKTLTPDRSAEFGGGLVEVNTLDIPTSNFLNVSVGGSYNDKTTGKDFLTLKRENKEYLGQVASHRNLLGILDWKSRNDAIAKFNASDKTANMFSNNWGLYNLKAAPSQNYQISGGRVMPVNGGEIGVVASFGYRNTLSTQDVRMSRDGFYSNDSSDVESYATFKGKRYGFTTNIGGLLAVGYRDTRNRIGFQSMYLRTLDEQLIIGTGYNADASGGGLRLGYYDLTTQTTLWQNLLKGEHTLGNRGIKFKWVGGYMKLDRQKPDNHQITTPFVKTDGSPNEYSISSAYSSGSDRGALRWWTRALESNYTWDASLSVPVQFNIGKVALNNTFKAGYAGWSKDRLFYVLNIGSTFNNHDGNSQPLAQAFTAKNDVGYNIIPFGDNFHRSVQLHAVYGMLDTKIGNRLRLVGGLRAEYYNLNGANAVLDSLFSQINKSRGIENKLDYSELLNREPNWNFFPSVNLTYSLTPDMNLRLAYAKSIIRPDLRDLSYFREYDFELGGIYQSNTPVQSTIAQHYDFRYEWYPGAGEVMSFSLFYKKFDYPMEIYANTQSGGIFELKNDKSAKNYGLEVEMRKSLAFTEVSVLRNFTLYGNFTTLKSYVTPMDIDYNALDPTNPLKVTPVEKIAKEEKRPQAGASNYIVNAGVYYDVKPVSASVVYNYVSNRMFRPDKSYQYSLFERPLQSLDAQLAIRFLKQHGEIKFNVSNLLNSSSLVYSNRFDGEPEIENGTKAPATKQLLYQSDKDAIDFRAKPGRTYSTTISYKF